MKSGGEETTSYIKILLIAIVIGIIAGVGALLFFEGLKWGTHFCMESLIGYHLPDEGQSISVISGWTPPPNIWLILPLICSGALISGFLVYTFAPEAEGHGTDAAIRAFHEEGRIRWRIPILKAVTSILTISTGGSAGREGPTAQISAGFGSIAADFLGLSEHERRIAIATGIGAGIGTIFKAPLGGALLSAEILYTRDIESEAVIPAFLASIIGYSIFGIFEGYDPIFGADGIIWTITQIPLFILLGIICAGVGILYIRIFYGTRDIFRSFFTSHNLPNHIKPFCGAFIIGSMVIALAHISPEGLILALGGLGTGYGFLQLAMYSMLPLSVLLFLPFFKIITTSLTIGSGGSGGVFAPGLAIGGATGGAVGTFLHLALPVLVPMQSIPAFVIVGMIALFGAIANAPVAVMIMAVEMTGDFSLLIPAMGAVAISYIITGEDTIFIEQVHTKAQSTAHRGEYLREVLMEIRTGDAMIRREEVITISPQESCRTVLSYIDQTSHTGFPVCENNEITGIITIGDLRQAKNDPDMKVENCMTRKIISVSPETSLEDALALMIDNDIHHLPVTDSENSKIMRGFLTSTDIMRTYTRKVSRLRTGDEQ